MHHFYLQWWKKWWFQANCDYDFSSILVGSPYHTRFQLWIVQVVSKERHTKQLMSTTERKQHEMAHYLSPSIYSLYIFWPLSSVNLLSIPFICIPIYVSYVILYELHIWKSDEVPETAPEPRILQICKKHLQNGGRFSPVTWTGVPDWHRKPRYHPAACWTQQLKWAPALLKDLGQVSPPCFSVFSALFDGHPSHQERAQPGNGEKRGTRRLYRAFSPHLMAFTGEPEHRAFSKPPWPAAEEDNRLREG